MFATFNHDMAVECVAISFTPTSFPFDLRGSLRHTGSSPYPLSAGHTTHKQTCCSTVDLLFGGFIPARPNTGNVTHKSKLIATSAYESLFAGKLLDETCGRTKLLLWFAFLCACVGSLSSLSSCLRPERPSAGENSKSLTIQTCAQAGAAAAVCCLCLKGNKTFIALFPGRNISTPFSSPFAACNSIARC